MQLKAGFRGALVAAGALFAAGLALGWFARGGAAPGEASGGAPPAFVFENPLVRVQPGEWALYRTLDGNTHRVEALEPPHPRTGMVRVKEEVWNTRADRLVSSTERLLFPNRFLREYEAEGARIERLYPDEVTVAGRTWKALCLEVFVLSEGRVRDWYSAEAPVTGFLKREKMGTAGVFKVDRELIDWGVPESEKE